MSYATFFAGLTTEQVRELYKELTNKELPKDSRRTRILPKLAGVAKVAGEEALVAACIKLGILTDNPNLDPPAPAVDPAPVETSAPAVDPAPAIDSTPVGDPAPVVTSTPAPIRKRIRRGTYLCAVPGRPVACRVGTKQAILVDCLSRPEGVTMAQLLEALSGGRKPWLEVTVRSAFSWDMKQKGYGVRSAFDEYGTERFFLILPKDENGEDYPIPPHRSSTRLGS